MHKSASLSSLSSPTAHLHRMISFYSVLGIERHDVSVLFQVISANRLRHFTLAILHGACINSCHPRCKLLSLYPVKSIRK